MINLTMFFQVLKDKGFNTIIGVPCSMLNSIFDFLSNSQEFDYIGATNEGEAVAIAVGANLAGKKAIVVCQNSGLGNMVNPLSSLVSPFKIPLLIIMSWRGNPKKQDEPQHELIGKITIDLLEMLKTKVIQFPENDLQIKEKIDFAQACLDKGNSCCFIVENELPVQKNKDHFVIEHKYKNNLKSFLDLSDDQSPYLSRWEVLEKIINFFPKNTALICSTGKSSRELFTLNDSNRNFYMVGSMGCASAIGLGIAKYSSKRIVVIDGDGALLMKMGNMATIGHYSPLNFFHILINNGVHDSTGGQRTVSETVNYAKIAQACNYNMTFSGHNNLEACFDIMIKNDGPHFFEIKTAPGSIESIGRPTLPLDKIASRFSAFIQDAEEYDKDTEELFC